MVYKKGSKGEIVKRIQSALHLYPDGLFGNLTEDAVKLFQKKNNLTVDGIVGPATLLKILKFSFKKSKRTIKEIIVHCSATPEGKDFTVDDIRRWHKLQGWSDIGYHYVVYRDGTIANGRDVDIIGAHCNKDGHNMYSIGVCYIGGVDAKNSKKAKDTRTDAQKDALLSFLKELKELYPNAKIYGHRDFDSSKECPSFDAKNEYKNI